jgi:diguanylate cyclase (GGDEF)-like protein
LSDDVKLATTDSERRAHEEFVQADRERSTETLKRILAVCTLACALVVGYGTLTRDVWPVILAGIGLVGMGCAYTAVKRGYTHFPAFIVASVALFIVTANAATGLGLHDLSVMAMPVIIMFAGLTLQRRHIYVFVTLYFLCLLFILGNQQFEWFTLRNAYETVAAQLFISLLVGCVTTYGVWLLATSSRQGLELAHKEIDHRVTVERELESLSARDALTGICSRHFFEAEVERFQITSRYPVSVILADVDNLKRINDTMGHAAGDKVLRQAAEVLGSAIRTEDVLARIGGDEFAILLPCTDATTVTEVANRIEVRLRLLQTAGLENLSLSLGQATAYSGGLGEALVLADARMHEQKAGARGLADSQVS